MAYVVSPIGSFLNYADSNGLQDPMITQYISTHPSNFVRHKHNKEVLS